MGGARRCCSLAGVAGVAAAVVVAGSSGLASPFSEVTGSRSAGEGAVARSSPAAASGGMTLVSTKRRMPISGDPIWELELTLPGQKARRFPALVGRKDFQTADRHRLGSQAPLPPGPYEVNEIEPMRPGDDPQLGRFFWIGLEPLFPTDRRALGIHHDPSAGRGRNSGTNGCIGLINGNDVIVLADLLRRHGTRYLVVKD